jgi:enterochelin esterase-like enzyme
MRKVAVAVFLVICVIAATVEARSWRPPRDVVQESDNTVCDVLTVGNDELRLIVYTAFRRSETADRIQQLHESLDHNARRQVSA